MKRPLTLLLIGAGFAVGMTVAMSCNIGRSSSAAQDKGEKKESKEAREEDDDDEVSIKLSDAPEPVRAAILKLTPEKSIKKVIREGDDGVVVFEVEYEASGAACSADISDKGTVMSLEKEIKSSDLPEAALKSLTQRFPTGKIKTVAAVQMFLYEADVEVDGKGQEVKVYASGKMPGHH